jgi:hypothetical protein
MLRPPYLRSTKATDRMKSLRKHRTEEKFAEYIDSWSKPNRYDRGQAKHNTSL